MKEEINILIIGVNTSLVSGLEERLNHLGFRSRCTLTPDQPIDELKSLGPDMAVLGPALDIGATFRCINKLKIIDPAMPILTCFDNDMRPGKVAREPFEGVYDLSHDPDIEEISEALHGALTLKTGYGVQSDLPLIVGQSEDIRTIKRKIQKVCDKDITVLVTGDTGTGKELIARSIHYHSKRNKGPLVKINCGALPDELLESEVFGFQKGAFTGAHRDKPGRLEMADGGTVFIDEIGDLSLSLQVKFLQVLEDKAFSRLGATQDKVVDTRVIAATNVDLWKEVRKGTFRKDIFYRLNVVHIEAPPLRGRKDDILLLIHYFLNKYCFEFKKGYPDMSDKIVDFFLSYHWPGNVRELENVVRRAIALKNWGFIFDDLNQVPTDQDVEHGAALGTPSVFSDWHNDKVKKFFKERDFTLKKLCNAYVSEAERHAILKALRQTQWNRKKAAQLLKVSYKTLLNRILEFDLKP